VQRFVKSGLEGGHRQYVRDLLSRHHGRARSSQTNPALPPLSGPNWQDLLSSLVGSREIMFPRMKPVNGGACLKTEASGTPRLAAAQDRGGGLRTRLSVRLGGVCGPPCGPEAVDAGGVVLRAICFTPCEFHFPRYRVGSPSIAPTKRASSSSKGPGSNRLYSGSYTATKT
jgi:hypothetical protein